MTTVLVSPFSNSDIRDWPLERYRSLVGLLLSTDPEIRIRVIGTQNQRVRANEIVRPYDASRVSNDCGKLAWRGIERLCLEVDCVVANNSGVAHMAASAGARVVCLFGGSHERHEWRPIGPNVTLVTQTIGCSPCGLDHGAACPFNKKCLWDITSETVASAVVKLLAQVAV